MIFKSKLRKRIESERAKLISERLKIVDEKKQLKQTLKPAEYCKLDILEFNLTEDINLLTRMLND